jgi:hypothetical protein
VTDQTKMSDNRNLYDSKCTSSIRWTVTILGTKSARTRFMWGTCPIRGTRAACRSQAACHYTQHTQHIWNTGHAVHAARIAYTTRRKYGKYSVHNTQEILHEQHTGHTQKTRHLQHNGPMQHTRHVHHAKDA